MTDGEPDRNPDRWEAEFDGACQELRDSLLGKTMAECPLLVELWEQKFRRSHPHLQIFIRNHVEITRLLLSRNQGTTVNFIKVGDNSNFQQGSNVANSGSNIAAGQSNTVNAPKDVPTPAAEPTLPAESPLWVLNLGLGSIVGSLAAWWWLPDEWAFGRTRLVVTVFVTVAGAVSGTLGWFQFRRGRWEKMLYAGLALSLIVRSSLPTVGGSLGFGAQANRGTAEAGTWAYLFVDDNPWLVGLQIVAAVVLCAFAWSTKCRP